MLGMISERKFYMGYFMKRILLSIIILLVCATISLSAQSDKYYHQAQENSGPELRNILHILISNHRRVSYSSLWYHYKKTDVRPNGKPWCIYSDYEFKDFKQNQGGGPGKIGSYLTREHSWPKQWWGEYENGAYSDLFHVFLSDAHVNGQKGIKPLGEVGEKYQQWAISKVGLARKGLGFTGEVFEPADKYKGDFTRAYLYFAVRYLTGKDALDCSVSDMIKDNGIEFEDWAINMLLRWHKLDPVSERERKRNEELFKIQGNRNPFIDHPEYADLIWGNKFMIGVDANYALSMINNGKTWAEKDNKENIFKLLSDKGIRNIRIRLWTCDTGPSSFDYAKETALQAQKNGITPYIVLFLSDDWSDYVKQPVPQKWSKYSFEDKLKAVQNYSREVIEKLRKNKVKTHIYEIGNEIDFGICGEFAETWDKRFNMNYMKKHIWPKAAEIIRAAQSGVFSSDKKAKFILHLTQWWNTEFCIQFFDFMLKNNVTVDYIGLSFFPSSNLSKENDFKFFLSKMEVLAKTIKRPIIICEYAYPSIGSFGGQFAEWNQKVDGYNLNEAGQAKWIKDFLKVVKKSKYIKGAFYWSPEWYSSEMWKAFSLFDQKGNAKKGINSFLDGVE